MQLRFLCMINGMYLQTIHLLTLVEKSDDESLNGKSLKGEPLERTPRHAANAKLEWDYTQDITFYSSLNYTGKQIWAAQRNGAKVPPRS